MKRILICSSLLMSSFAFSQQQEQPEEMIVKTDILQKVMNYLVEKPYKEVAGLVQGIQKNVRPYVKPEPKPEPKEPTPSIPAPPAIEPQPSQ